MSEELHWLSEQLKTIKNLTDISQILININRVDLLPTVLEYLYEQAYDIVENHCIKEI